MPLTTKAVFDVTMFLCQSLLMKERLELSALDDVVMHALLLEAISSNLQLITCVELIRGRGVLHSRRDLLDELTTLCISRREFLLTHDEVIDIVDRGREVLRYRKDRC